jgi:micrococcal nuclease
MKSRIPAALWLLLLVLCLFWATPLLAQDVRVKWVQDGDTLHLEDGRKIRLVGIDAPEMGNDGAPDQYFARESRDYLRRLVEDRPLRLKTDGQGLDRYNRVFAVVFLPDGRMVNKILVDQGLAFFYPHAQQSRKFQNALLNTQKRAIFSRQGFWPRILSLPSPAGGWVGNRRSKRFHHPQSHYAQRISSHNRVIFISLLQAFWDGYVPARTSSPWPDAGHR